MPYVNMPDHEEDMEGRIPSRLHAFVSSAGQPDPSGDTALMQIIRSKDDHQWAYWIVFDVAPDTLHLGFVNEAGDSARSLIAESQPDNLPLLTLLDKKLEASAGPLGGLAGSFATRLRVTGVRDTWLTQLPALEHDRVFGINWRADVQSPGVRASVGSKQCTARTWQIVNLLGRLNLGATETGHPLSEHRVLGPRHPLMGAGAAHQSLHRPRTASPFKSVGNGGCPSILSHRKKPG